MLHSIYTGSQNFREKFQLEYPLSWICDLDSRESPTPTSGASQSNFQIQDGCFQRQSEANILLSHFSLSKSVGSTVLADLCCYGVCMWKWVWIRIHTKYSVQVKWLLVTPFYSLQYHKCIKPTLTNYIVNTIGSNWLAWH